MVLNFPVLGQMEPFKAIIPLLDIRPEGLLVIGVVNSVAGKENDCLSGFASRFRDQIVVLFIRLFQQFVFFLREVIFAVQGGLLSGFSEKYQS